MALLQYFSHYQNTKAYKYQYRNLINRNFKVNLFYIIQWAVIINAFYIQMKKNYKTFGLRLSKKEKKWFFVVVRIVHPNIKDGTIFMLNTLKFTFCL